MAEKSAVFTLSETPGEPTSAAVVTAERAAGNFQGCVADDPSHMVVENLLYKASRLIDDLSF